MGPGFRLCVTSGLYLLLFVAALRVFLVFRRIVSLQKRLFVNPSLNRKSNGHRFVKRKAIKCCHCEKVDLFRNQNKAELVKITATQILSTALVVFTLNLFYRSNLVPTTANSLFPRYIYQGTLMDIIRQKDHSVRFKVNSMGRLDFLR